MDRAKPNSHGLIDGFSMAVEMLDRESTMVTAASDGDYHIQPPGFGVTDFLALPDHLAAATIVPISAEFRKRHGCLPEHIDVTPAIYTRRWWDALAPLDRKSKVSPVLWVKRAALQEDPWADDPEAALIRFSSWPGESTSFYTVWASFEFNSWWSRDLARADQVLDCLCEKGLDDELASGQRIVRASRETCAFWEYRWVSRPTIFDDLEGEPSGHFPHPELDAIPFYRPADVKTVFDAVMQSYLCISLLDDVSDKQIASERWIAKAREQRGLPRTETRGRRPGRNPDLVEKIGRMVHQQGLTKYTAAKRLGMKRSTLYGHLAEYNKRPKRVG